MHSSNILFFEAIEKTLHLLNVQRVGLLYTLFAVILQLRKGRLFGLCFFLVAMGLDSNCPFVGMNFGGSTIMGLN